MEQLSNGSDSMSTSLMAKDALLCVRSDVFSSHTLCANDQDNIRISRDWRIKKKTHTKSDRFVLMDGRGPSVVRAIATPQRTNGIIAGQAQCLRAPAYTFIVVYGLDVLGVAH